MVLGDLSLLSCDAWMLPTDEKFSLEKSWNPPEEAKGMSWNYYLTFILLTYLKEPPPEWSNERQRVIKVPLTSPNASIPWLVNVGGKTLPTCQLCRNRGLCFFNNPQ